MQHPMKVKVYDSNELRYCDEVGHYSCMVSVIVILRCIIQFHTVYSLYSSFQPLPTGQ